jgi:hypothetical protein
MARQNNIPKGAGPHLRTPHAAHDPSAPAQGYGSAYPNQYDAPENADQAGSAQRDIFSALRPESPSLASRFEPFAPPAAAAAGRPQTQSHYGRHQPQFGEPEGQPYAAPAYGSQQTHDPYGRPLPGGYGAGAEQDQQYFGQQPQHYGQQPQHGYAPQGQYGHEEAYAYDDPYRPNAADPYGGAQHVGAGADGGYYEDDFIDEPEIKTRRGPRAIVVVGALIGAIVLGGGLAYGYKAMTGGGRDGGKLPVLRADTAPAKAQPTDPGGKQVAHTDKKILNRLAENGGPARPVPVSILPATPERETGEGPRRVPTMVVNRDGTITSSGTSSPSAPPPASGVPGLVLEGFGGARAPAPPQREAAAPPPPPAQPQPQARALTVEPVAPPPPPRRVASAPPTAAIESPAVAVAPPEPRRPVPTRQAAVTPPPAPAPAPPAARAPGAPSLGYVAVVSSRQSHMDAVKALADIQQKHPGILQGRAADVREANLGDKGVWYRVVVGPPGSQETASSVCGEYKKLGYVGCWVSPY